MKLDFIIALLFFVCASQSYADLKCEGSSGNHKVQIILSRDVVKLDCDGELTTINGVKGVWDGHQMGMFTAEGFSMVYENHYGTYRNVNVTAYFNLGGSTFSHIATFQVNCVNVE